MFETNLTGCPVLHAAILPKNPLETSYADSQPKVPSLPAPEDSDMGVQATF